MKLRFFEPPRQTAVGRLFFASFLYKCSYNGFLESISLIDGFWRSVLSGGNFRGNGRMKGALEEEF
ncbi:hypothetical protein DWV91_11395 [Enterococcus asini]|nr:hypothetical protein DWV91_11395 [Enterococcus asini]